MSIPILYEKSYSTVAENEYLDASKARRWQSFAQAIRDGSSDSEVAERIEDCLYKTIRQIRRDLPLEDLVRHLNDPEQLRAMCHQIDGAHDVKYFLIEAADQDADLQGKLSYFLNQSLENCLYDVPYLVADSGGNVSITDARNTFEMPEEVFRQKSSGSLQSWQRIPVGFHEEPTGETNRSQRLIPRRRCSVSHSWQGSENESSLKPVCIGSS